MGSEMCIRDRDRGYVRIGKSNTEVDGSNGCLSGQRRSRNQQRESPLRKYFIPGCVGRGLDLDLRICPSPSPASKNLGFSSFGIGLEQQGFRTAWDITGQKFQGVGLKLKAFILIVRDLASRVCQKNEFEV